MPRLLFLGLRWVILEGFLDDLTDSLSLLLRLGETLDQVSIVSLEPGWTRKSCSLQRNSEETLPVRI